MQNFYDSIVDEMKRGDESQVAEQYRTELKALGKSLISQFIPNTPFSTHPSAFAHIFEAPSSP